MTARINQPLLHALIDARRTGTPLSTLPAEALPTTLNEAYATAEALAESFGVGVVGWKVGASIQRAWERLGLAEPFGGRIFTGTIQTSPAELEHVPGTLTIGAEFAFRLARDLRPDEDDFSAVSIASLIDVVYPALELNRPDFVNPMDVGGLCLIADNGVNIGLVLGQPLPDWRAVDLSRHVVAFSVNGVPRSNGCAQDIQFDPIAAVAWLANDRARRGDPLRAGQVVSSGDLILNVEANPGDRVRAEFGNLGTVELLLRGET